MARRTGCAIVLVLIAVSSLAAEFPPVEKLPSAIGLPDPFVFMDGSRVKTNQEWQRRRAELQEMILYYQYGRMPPPPGNVKGVELISHNFSGGADATHKQFRLTFGPEGRATILLDLTIPKGRGPFPVILRGDWGWHKTANDITANVIQRGYVLADYNRLEVAPDNRNRDAGAYPLYPEHDWGAVAAWAWGFHRCVDFLVTQDYVDKEKIAVTGHSRGGKAALLAGATDTRIALTAPNNSGCGGAGSYKHQAPKSEDIAAITKSFPFWFVPRFRDFIGQVDKLPFDQHSVKALCAPRALLTTEALGDLWANPEGTRQTHLAAKEVYKFLGAPDRIAIFYREGKHEHNAADWNVLLDFADEVFTGKKSGRDWDANPFPGAGRAFSWMPPPGP